MTTHKMTITPEAFAYMLASGQQKETVSDGLQTAIEMYYDEYTDADELDPEFVKALEVIGYVSSIYIEELIDEVEAKLRRQGYVQGRLIHTHTARCDHDNHEA